MLVTVGLGLAAVLQLLLFLALMVAIYRLSHGNELLFRLSRGAAVLFWVVAAAVIAMLSAVFVIAVVIWVFA